MVFTFTNSIIKTEKDCAKYVQRETKNKFFKTKCLKLNFYKRVHFLLFVLLSTLWIYHFHCFPISFLLLYLSFHLDPVHHKLDFPLYSHFHQIPEENSYFNSKTNTPLCYYCITLGTKSPLISSETSSAISPKKITLTLFRMEIPKSPLPLTVFLL